MQAVVETPRYLADAERLFTTDEREAMSISSPAIRVAALSSQVAAASGRCASHSADVANVAVHE
jgi:hypothetical protein